ncbi:hypothetical protein JTE90_007654 [Oedothorax gibbosus]|uniref:Uncharacterized protein n=1 Tax=Oedothorax gibbosus TaxID=931172 RepID=A0AAV6TRF9_9ARAC|nr:hypothetical protein JTE90_007654 [Oedothorax gibbosus]
MERTKEAECLARRKLTKEEREATQALINVLSTLYIDATDFRTARERIKMLYFMVPCLSLEFIHDTIEANDDLDPAWLMQLKADAENGFPGEPQVAAMFPTANMIQPLAESMVLSSDAQFPAAGTVTPDAQFPEGSPDARSQEGNTDAPAVKKVMPHMTLRWVLHLLLPIASFVGCGFARWWIDLSPLPLGAGGVGAAYAGPGARPGRGCGFSLSLVLVITY